MTIYRCDKCKKESTYKTDMYRIRITSDEYDPDKCYWRECNRSIYFDVCKECKDNIIGLFVKHFKSEGDENDKDIS